MGTPPRAPPRDLLVAGHVNLDRFLHVAQLPTPDRTVPLEDVETRLGGPAATLARTAARNGVSVGVVTRIGPDFPPEFLRALRAAHIDVRGIETVPKQRSPTCFVLEDRRGRQMTAIDPGPMKDWRGARMPDAVLRSYRWLHLVTGAPAYQLALLERAQRWGVRVAADPAQEVHYLWKGPDLARLLRPSEMLFGNRAEIGRILELRGRASVRSLLEEVPLIVVTLGSSGAVAYHRAGSERVAAIPVERPVTLVGAGDAFRGGFYGAWFAGSPLRECLRGGIRAASTWMRTGGPPVRTR